MRLIDVSTKQRPTTFVMVDDEDFDHLNQWKWRTNKEGYVVRSIPRHVILMHRLLVGAKNGDIIDHINGVILDNRKSNLRFCSLSQNSWNARRRKVTFSSVYKGVYYDKQKKRFEARIHVNGTAIKLGRFKIESDAGKAYDIAAVFHFGSFAVVNGV